MGYLLNKYGHICRTIDGGYTWQRVGAMAAEGRAISFTTDSSLYAAGLAGNIVRLKVLPVDSTVNTIALCGNTGIQLTSNITGTYYQWQIDTANGFAPMIDDHPFYNTNSAILDIYNVARAFGGYRFRCVVDGNSSNIFQLSIRNAWTGASNQNWNDPSNWSCGFVPDAKTDVVINTGPVVINSNVTIRSLTLAAGVQLTVNPGFILTITH
jgi:hypothetical protein